LTENELAPRTDLNLRLRPLVDLRVVVGTDDDAFYPKGKASTPVVRFFPFKLERYVFH